MEDNITIGFLEGGYAPLHDPYEIVQIPFAIEGIENIDLDRKSVEVLHFHIEFKE